MRRSRDDSAGLVAVDFLVAPSTRASVRLRVSRLLVVLALTISVGLHWAFLQSVAWVGMLVNYSHSTPLPEALSRTFGGQHPCALCKLVQTGKTDEHKKELKEPISKLECSLAPDDALISPRTPHAVPEFIPT